MTRTVIALAVAAAGTVGSISPAYGADGVAQFIQVHPRPGGFIYRLELAEDHLVGRRGPGDNVDLRKKDGVWSGSFGRGLFLAFGKADLMGDGSVRVTLRSARWGTQHQFVVRSTTAGDIELRGRGGWEGAHAEAALRSACFQLFLNRNRPSAVLRRCRGGSFSPDILRVDRRELPPCAVSGHDDIAGPVVGYESAWPPNFPFADLQLP